jgi:hypothetical protein
MARSTIVRLIPTLISGLIPIGAALVLAPALLHGQAAASGDPSIQRLSVAGRTNATPSIAALGDVVAVAWTATIPGGASDVYVAVSRDGGASFGAPILVNDRPGEVRSGGEMPPRVVLVPASTEASTRDPEVLPEIVVVWRARVPATSIRSARSGDGGRSFTPAVTLQSSEAVGERGWHTAAAGPDGRVHALWLDHRGLAPIGSTVGGTAGGTTGGRASGAASASAGADGHAAHRQAAAQQPSSPGAAFDGVAMAQKSGVYYSSAPAAVGVAAAGPVDPGARSQEPAAGHAPNAERELARGVCYCCKTALAAGPNGAVYAAWRHVYEGNIRDIAFVASRDGGRTFSAPARVSEDRWQLAGCPDDGPAMAVDAGGVAHLVWPTVIGGDRPQGAIFYASTRDGRTFTPRVRVPGLDSPKPQHPQLALASDGRVLIAWDETVDGVRRAAVVTMTIAGHAAPAFSAPVLLEASTASTPRATVYPVLATTPRDTVAAWTSGSGETSAIAVRRLPLAANGVRPRS